ncbi:ABC transporter substrate-binding protein [Gordonia spumicola]|uniref:ABC transporter substrate-binding protein n=1 Tax=Gordonia spumicola TaxID=589161 RepID=A0A7I9V3H8_9ACTN|nr:MCE family protein [Gordonia spumicola]GED99742.1 ABC transporter substrate-binding protein [Gordonia spumicola]
MATAKRRLLGLVFFVVVFGLLAAAILKFQGTFDKYTTVTFETTNAGNALAKNADVKARGVVVGTVRSIEVQPGGKARVELGLDPDKVKDLPVGTTGRVLPKTLFGERFVSLTVPVNGTGSLSEGSVIQTDPRGSAAEVEDLFDALMPVLKAIPPQDLNQTLTAISQAIGGKGKQLGSTIDRLNTIFKRVNANMDDLQGTLRGLASFSQTYSQALPDVIDALDSLRVTGNTLVERKSDFVSLISTLSVASTDTTKFLRKNRRDLLDLAIDSEPFLRALANQSPTFGCMFHNFSTLMPKIGPIVGKGTDNPGVRVNLQFVNPRGRYLPNQDEPRMLWTNPPARCYEPASNGRPFPQYPGGGIPDGSYQVPSRNAGPTTWPDLPQPQFSGTPSGTVYDDPDYVKQMQIVYGASSGVEPADVPTWVTYIGGGSVHGTQVAIK